ncbi:hypothetical protein [Parasulfitobacter algicola]|uniref:Uncharacterized protein n=1 Tax=Parasulfitobacter algicola TaxID=2614809 RepID=A0ABX2IQ77_9RHOB|nr:hypothetical protein [Sulfitobacter algicola]NSX53260.1 hypothetical protein [Sulfitobacter algicola]
MDRLSEIETSILDDDDGSCRDVNFLQPTWDGVEEFIKRSEKLFREYSSADGEGNSLLEPYWKSVKASVQKTGYVHLSYANSFEIINNVQIFVCSEDDGSPFIELTFFPEDVAVVSNLETVFIGWVGAAKFTLQASEYFCRYENASWTIGDISPGSGVFLASENIST